MDIFNAFKGIEGDIQRAVDGTMPRQAVVTRADGNTVWVRYAPVDPGTPEMQFPSTVAGLPAGATGWVYSLAGGKGLFVASDVMRPITKNSLASAGRNGISTAGDYTIPATPTTANSLILFTGLVPGRFYRLSWQCTYSAWISGTTNARWAVRIIHGGGTWWNGYNGFMTLLNQQFAYHWNHSAVVSADSAGEISICPAVRWDAGQINVTWETITATLSEE